MFSEAFALWNHTPGCGRIRLGVAVEEVEALVARPRRGAADQSPDGPGGVMRPGLPRRYDGREGSPLPCTEAGHLVWLKSLGQTTPQIAEATGYSPGWVRTLIHRYNDGAAEALKDRRHAHPGAAPLLMPEQEAELDAVLNGGRAPDGGPWTGPKVARWIEQAMGRERVHDQRGWDYLVRLGFSAQTPRPAHEQADSAAQAASKKQPR